MGGNALNKVITIRLPKDEYLIISNAITSVLEKENIEHVIPKSYRNKTSFGDLDVLINKKSVEGVDIIKFIQDKYSPVEIVTNDNVYSFDYKNFQIDFIIRKEFNTSKVFYSYNDLAILIGIIATHMGFKYSHAGLFYKQYFDNKSVKHEIFVSDQMDLIFEFLGFDFDRFLDGFDEMDEVFEYVINSPFFNRKKYYFGELNHDNRTRNKKRKNYNQFVNKIRFMSDKDNYEFEKPEFYVDRAEKFFNIDLKSKIQELKEFYNRKRFASNKFNGKTVLDNFNVEPKSLNKLMKKFKDRIYNEVKDDGDNNHDIDKKYYDWIINNDINEIINKFKKINKL